MTVASQSSAANISGLMTMTESARLAHHLLMRPYFPSRSDPHSERTTGRFGWASAAGAVSP